ncbi:MAG: FtsQ-type POTRA domain-containing protein [Acidobacteriota bacterium]
MTLASDPKPFSFLRLPSAARRRRARPWLALARRSLRVLALTAPVVLLAAWLLWSPRFALQRLDVEGARRVEATWLESQLSSVQGHNLLLIELDDLRQALQEHRWVRSASLSKRLPNRLEVAIVEHQPVALLQSGERVAAVSQYGEIVEGDVGDLRGGGLEIALLAAFEPGSERERAVVGEALRTGQEVRAATPSWCGSLERVEVLSPGHLRLSFSELPFAVLVRSDSALERVELFDRLLPQVIARFSPLRHVDLRASRRIVLQPAPVVG